MTNISAAEQTLDHLRQLGRIEVVDTALVEAIRSMAKALDDDPSNAALWRQYREALRDVREVVDDVDDAFADALAQIRGAAEMGHATP